MGNINIELPEELHKEIKIFCAIHGISIKDFLIKSLEEDAEKKEADEKKKKKS
ncbi:type II toxin-antitoxin system HicB family antitoxin [Candidatus Woesearchaeota archaeon]|nr:type II toxin-antitoxin system HicB family antitoxin [Candidatus Woesearchaeota archaeon]